MPSFFGNHSTNDSFSPFTYRKQQVIDGFKDQRQRIQKFLIHFISECVFTSDKVPDDEILDWLFVYISHSQSEKENETGLFDHKQVIIPERFTKSVFLKHVLRLGETDQESPVCEKLESYINSFMKDHKGLEDRRLMILLKDAYMVSISFAKT